MKLITVLGIIIVWYIAYLYYKSYYKLLADLENLQKKCKEPAPEYREPIADVKDAVVKGLSKLI